MTRKQLTTKCATLVALLLIFITPHTTSAQHTYKFRDSLGTYEVKFTPTSNDIRIAPSPTKPLAPNTHEIRLGTGWIAHTYWGQNTLSDRVYDHSVKPNEKPSFYGESKWYTLNIDYGYWIKEWLYVGGVATWTSGYLNRYDSITQRRLYTINEHIFGIMATSRFAWYRRGIIQLYSGCGIGVGGVISESGYYRENRGEACVMFDVTAIGVSAGRKWFGYADVGYGSRGVIRVGFGYRFTNKK